MLHILSRLLSVLNIQPFNLSAPSNKEYNFTFVTIIVQQPGICMIQQRMTVMQKREPVFTLWAHTHTKLHTQVLIGKQCSVYSGYGSTSVCLSGPSHITSIPASVYMWVLMHEAHHRAERYSRWVSGLLRGFHMSLCSYWTAGHKTEAVLEDIWNFSNKDLISPHAVSVPVGSESGNSLKPNVAMQFMSIPYSNCLIKLLCKDRSLKISLTVEVQHQKSVKYT